MTKFQNKYRVETTRAQWWDYGWNGAYFITICTQGRVHHFGHIENKKMILSPTGTIADIFWKQIPNHFPFVELGAFVVMPNHVHGILVLDKSGDGSGPVDTGHALYLPPGQSRRGNQGKKTVSSIIGSYKSAVTKQANRLGLPNGWQSRFHDHIIRNDAQYQRISNYIICNPENW